MKDNPQLSEPQGPGTSKLDWRYFENNKVDRNELQVRKNMHKGTGTKMTYFFLSNSSKNFKKFQFFIHFCFFAFLRIWSSFLSFLFCSKSFQSNFEVPCPLRSLSTGLTSTVQVEPSFYLKP